MKKTVGLVLFFVIFLISSSFVFGAVINVPAGQPTIQAAINAANNGDIINVSEKDLNPILQYIHDLIFRFIDKKPFITLNHNNRIIEKEDFGHIEKKRRSN